MLNKDILNHYIVKELIDNLYYADSKILSMVIKELLIETHSKNDIDNIKQYCNKSLINTINVLSSINNKPI